MPAPHLSAADRAQAVAARALFALPPAAQRRIAGGAPVVRDGQTLDPEVQLALFLLDQAGDPPLEDLTPAAGRAQISHEAALFAGPKIPVADVQALTVAGAAGPLAARRYVPARFASPGPTLVYFHGGGWVVGDLDSHDQTCRLLARHSGAAVIAVDYRLAPEHPFPAPVDDALAAFRDVAARAPELGADPARIGVGGDSAGGHLSAVTCLLAAGDGGPAPAFQVLIYPVTDSSKEHPSYDLFADGFFLTRSDMHWYQGHFLPAGTDRRDARVSPLLAADLSGAAPAYVVTAGFDPLRDEGEAYAARLREAGVRVTHRRQAGLIHGFVNMVGMGRAGRAATLEIAGALQVGLAG
jgi:acetyl esterase